MSGLSVSRRALLGGAAAIGIGGAALRGSAAAATVGSGVAMPLGNLPGWKQTIAEDFNTAIPLGGFVASPTTYGELAQNCAAYATYGKRLGVYGNGSANTYGYYDVSKTLSTSSSVLDTYLHVDPATSRRVSAAVFPLRGGLQNSHTYGRWSYRMRSYNATGSGWGCATLLWPADDKAWPASGEIDWPEGDIKAQPLGMPGKINGFFHPRDATNGWEGTVQIPSLNGMWTNWHTFTIEWLPNSLKVYLGTQLVMARTSHVPSTPMRWVSQTGPNNDALGRPVLPSGSSHVQIDWVVAYDPA
ncbi:glycoside hydrolase family 16 protein [Allobranchiibius sp. CTAmp26]|nr:glycoside hydrolase family 16 protein [Allobranchiibius sp. CTAmp26]